jgi:putative flippase GtrA
MSQETLHGVRQFGRFLGVGAVNAVLGLLVIYAAKAFFGVGDIGANLLGYGVGMTVSFVLNSRWTFEFGGAWGPAVVRFVIVSAVAYAANLLTVLAAIHVFSINSYVAQALGIPVYTFIVFGASKYLVFRPDAGVGRTH